ncbi:iron-siderophore ABC transporter substrate-binding protein [Amycolatopsis antarctica]|uniref:Iron-siderophore ABC transporter substrate-binding protein n=1 Tax=Amycolatopsis antarctica TaxID=1854586 RepID=A0A263D1L4_9PSEU|nr:ABC transporter substrate-binding protein [Amycolatopsis antarctica]OZM71235.1 iron-siderophore ABC transporter substrate-binding protein [Amycolatopsis antarctica]
MTKLPGARLRVLGAVALTVAFALTGCAATESDTGEQAQTPVATALPAAEGTTQYPLTVQSRKEAVLEKRPERIAVLGFSTNLDVLEVLGVTPVYAQREEAEWEWRNKDWLAGIEVVDAGTRRDPVNVEGIAATNPDLILSLNYAVEDADYERLSAIAPVLEKKADVSSDQIDWRELQRLAGEALDLPAASEQAIAKAERAIADVAARHPRFAGKTITIATEYSSGLEYYTVAGGTAETFVRALGFMPNPLAESFVANPKIASEQVRSLDADALVVGYNSQAIRAQREADQLFQSIPAVAQGRYTAVVAGEEGSGTNAIWVMRRGASALSLPWAAETVASVWLSKAGLTG